MANNSSDKPRKSSISLRLAAVVGLGFLVSACGDGPAPTGSDTGDTVGTVTVTPASVTMTVGEAHQLAATVRNGQGSVVSVVVTWSSSSSAVATVTSTGLVEAVGEGTATITASAQGKSGSASVTTSNEAGQAQVYVMTIPTMCLLPTMLF